MRPLALAQRGHEPSVGLADLLTGDRPPIIGDTHADLATYTAETLGSGFPGLRALPDRIRRAQIDAYVDRVVDHDIAELGSNARNPSALKRWMAAYAAATASTTTYSKIADAADPALAVALLGLDAGALLQGDDRGGETFQEVPSSERTSNRWWHRVCGCTPNDAKHVCRTFGPTAANARWT
mgnify:CR=1 FL=1